MVHTVEDGLAMEEENKCTIYGLERGCGERERVGHKGKGTLRFSVYNVYGVLIRPRASLLEIMKVSSCFNRTGRMEILIAVEVLSLMMSLSKGINLDVILIE